MHLTICFYIQPRRHGISRNERCCDASIVINVIQSYANHIDNVDFQ